MLLGFELITVSLFSAWPRLHLGARVGWFYACMRACCSLRAASFAATVSQFCPPLLLHTLTAHVPISSHGLHCSLVVEVRSICLIRIVVVRALVVIVVHLLGVLVSLLFGLVRVVFVHAFGFG